MQTAGQKRPWGASSHVVSGALALAAVLLVATGGIGRSRGEERPASVGHGEQQQVRLVLLPATVTRGQRVVRGLEAGQFRLFEDYVPQEIKYFTSDLSERISVAFLLDLSGSMRQLDRLGQAKRTIRGFIESLRPEDQFALIGFADDQVAWITDFTSDRELFGRRLAVQEAYGQTALYDAVARAPQIVDDKIAGRKALVLITDGIDNASQLTTFKAMQLARSVNVPIYSIGFSNLPRKLVGAGGGTMLRVLELISDETGGLLFTVEDAPDLERAARGIVRDLRTQYLIGYYPTRSLWDGSFRRIRLETVKGGLSVRTRSGYYATP